jgi:type II secretory pathway component PulC
MELLLRRHFWVVDLVAVAIAAALLAHATSLRIASVLLAEMGPVPARARPREVASADKSIEAVVGRNVFCSSCGDEPVPEPSRRPLSLLAIMFAPPPFDPRSSVAVVRDDEAITTGPYVVGDRLGDATVSAIESVRVVLDVGGGRREYLELLVDPPPRPANARSAPPSALAGGIRKTGPHSYEVRRALLDHLGEVTPPWPRVVPEVRDGQPGGFRLFGVGDGSPVALLGLSSGDLLLQVNGRLLAKPDDALAAYAALRTSEHIWLLVERDGRRVRLDYLIR